ncbi:hypothetical protein VKT23_013476 [Stygiomarasmius scandens]|uniref:Uncharacterized protein n=1 Tax=Marasmiellus scandens TaxID=2682957 RepID=A0ABR1J440_9AGAR
MSPRLLWFIVGAGAATWWHKHHEYERVRYGQAHGDNGYRPSCGSFDARFSVGGGNGVNTSVESNSGPDGRPEPKGMSWSSRSPWELKSWGWNPDRPGLAPPVPQSSDVPTPAMDQEQLAVINEQRKFAEMTKHIGNTVSEFSEATLDSLMNNAAALKAKLAEQRQQREQQELERKREEEYRRMNPPRYV